MLGPEDVAPREGQVADPLVALREECEQISEIGADLSQEDFARPTRCTAWNVKELLGHIYRDVDRISAGLVSDAPPEATHDSISYWRAYDPIADAPDVADRAKQLADRYGTGRELVEAWDEMWPRTLDQAAGADRKQVIVTWGPAITLNEFLKTRVLEVTVHRMDLEDALGRKGWGTDLAVSIVDDILEGLLGEEPPSDLEWDVVDFIEAGAGRRPLTDAERASLGRLADRFPLLG